jgi:hypothetical protein
LWTVQKDSTEGNATCYAKWGCWATGRLMNLEYMIKQMNLGPEGLPSGTEIAVYYYKLQSNHLTY